RHRVVTGDVPEAGEGRGAYGRPRAARRRPVELGDARVAAEADRPAAEREERVSLAVRRFGSTDLEVRGRAVDAVDPRRSGTHVDGDASAPEIDALGRVVGRRVPGS